MPKLDAYLRSIEKFGARGAILTSNQAITLRFPTGDRQATQVTPHDQIVAMMREVAPPAALDLIDTSRPARFEYGGYSIGVVQRPGAWMVTIEVGVNAPTPIPTPATMPPTSTPRTRTVPTPVPSAIVATDMQLESTQYDTPVGERTASGSVVLDELTRGARNARASDVYLSAGASPIQRIDGALAGLSQTAIPGDQLSREIGLVAPPAARSAWSERGAAVFGYTDGAGRIRATLGRDQRGPTAALRLLPSDPIGIDLGIGDLFDRSGLVLVVGASGSGKTIALGSIVRSLAERHRRVVVIEDPIEVIHSSSWISQREVGPHVASVGAGIAHAMLEGSDAIAVGALVAGDAALALVDAIAGGHFVVTTLVAPVAAALDLFVDLIPSDRRERSRSLVGHALLGTVIARGDRSFEVLRPERRG